MSTASERLSRLLALVPYLLARPGARVADVARDFGVSEAQVVADLKLAWFCGLPGHTPADLIDVDIEGGVVHVSNADTIARPLRLAPDEALALLVGLRSLAEVPGLSDREALDRAVAKLERAAGAAAAALAARVAVDVEAEPDVLAAVRSALADGRRVHLGYHVPGRDETTERDVDPMRVLLAEGRSYLEAWCGRAEAVRLFRLDRVTHVEVLDTAARVPPHARPRDLEAGLFQASPDDLLVTLELEPAARWVADYYPCETVTESPAGELRVVLRTPDTEWVRRLVLRLGGAARAVEPAALAAEVESHARAALAAYDPPP